MELLKVLIIVGVFSGSLWARSATIVINDECKEYENVLTNITQWVTRKVQVRHYRWCFNVPPRCSYYTEEVHRHLETVEGYESRLVTVCCPEFFMDPATNTCVPLCSRCQRGYCFQNICDCDPGFAGSFCQYVCPETRWGYGCRRICECQHGKCDPVNGHCECQNGWGGKSCNETMPTTVEVQYTSTSPILTTIVERKSTPTFTDSTLRQKHHMLIPITQKPEMFNTLISNTSVFKVLTSSNGRLTGITKLTVENNTKEAQTVKLEVSTIQAPADLETTEETNFSIQTTNDNVHKPVLYPSDFYGLDNITLNDTNGLIIHYDDSPHLLFSVGAIIGVSSTIVFMIVALFVIRIYVKRKPGSVISVVAKRCKNDKGTGVCIYTSSMYQSSLPDPPNFGAPVFTTPLEFETKPCDFSGEVLAHQVIYSVQMPTHSTFKKETFSTNTLYDHPPSTGSYTATSIPEPPLSDHYLDLSNCTEPKDHLYDEIPFKTNNDEDNLLSYYANCKDIN